MQCNVVHLDNLILWFHERNFLQWPSNSKGNIVISKTSSLVFVRFQKIIPKNWPDLGCDSAPSFNRQSEPMYLFKNSLCRFPFQVQFDHTAECNFIIHMGFYISSLPSLATLGGKRVAWTSSHEKVRVLPNQIIGRFATKHVPGYTSAAGSAHLILCYLFFNTIKEMFASSWIIQFHKSPVGLGDIWSRHQHEVCSQGLAAFCECLDNYNIIDLGLHCLTVFWWLVNGPAVNIILLWGSHQSPVKSSPVMPSPKLCKTRTLSKMKRTWENRCILYTLSLYCSLY